MKIQVSSNLKAAAFALILVSPFASKAQTEVVNLRPYDKSGINIFEAAKDSNSTFDKVKVQFGAGFTQSL